MCSYRRRPSSGEMQLESYSPVDGCKRHHEALGRRRLGAFGLGRLRQHTSRHARRVIDRLPKLALRIDHDSLAASKRPPARGDVAVKFEVLQAWLDHLLHQVLAVAEQIDQLLVAIGLEHVQDHGFAVGAKSRIGERIVRKDDLRTVFDRAPDVLWAKACVDERLRDAQLYQIEEAQIELFHLELFQLAAPQCRVVLVPDYMSAKPPTDFRSGDMGERRRLPWRIQAYPTRERSLFTGNSLGTHD